MKRHLSYITRISGITIVAMGLMTQVAHAQIGTFLNFLGYSGGLTGFILQILADSINYCLGVCAWFVALSGLALNLSLELTIHIKDFVDATPAIYQVWAAIRDVSGILIIFMLLYAAIKLILGFDDNMGPLIKSIIIAGILINFSFLAVSVLIDASNVVSLAIYDATVPSNLRTHLDQTIQNPNNVSSIAGVTGSAGSVLGAWASNSINDGGLSAIFMQNLQVQTLYQNGTISDSAVTNAATANSSSAPGATSTFLRLIMAGLFGIAIMIITALSFFAAAAAFIVRFVILLFLLAFSALWCGAYILPNSSLPKKYWNLLWSQLIFMPAYMLLMWVGLVILNGGVSGGKPLFSAASQIAPTGSAGATWYGPFVVLTINFAIVAIMLAIPLIVAMSLGGAATAWVGKSKFDPKVAWKKMGTVTGSIVGRNTMGRSAAAIRDSGLGRQLEGKSPFAGRLMNKGLTGVAKSSFGGGKGAGYDDVRKRRTEEYTKLASHSNYTREEAEEIAMEQGAMSRDGKLINDFPTIGLQRELTSLQNDYSRKGGELVNETDLSERERIKGELATIQAQINAKTAQIESRKGDVVKNIQEKPKREMAQKFYNKRSLLNRATGGKLGKDYTKWGRSVSGAIRKEKKPVDDILDQLNSLKSSSGGAGGTP